METIIESRGVPVESEDNAKVTGSRRRVGWNRLSGVGAEAKGTGARRLCLGQQPLDDELNQTIVPILS